MPFEKNHKLGFVARESQPLDRKPLTIKVRPGVREQVMSIPNWQSELRDVIELWLQGKVDPEDQL
ncbi:hypothetical protein [Nostoc sp.]|uniref:hypothetical protein n=1 Tax=Nostoc sp. TaxID=1180 RepID=UPI002FF8EBFA